MWEHYKNIPRFTPCKSSYRVNRIGAFFITFKEFHYNSLNCGSGRNEMTKLKHTISAVLTATALFSANSSAEVCVVKNNCHLNDMYGKTPVQLTLESGKSYDMSIDVLKVNNNTILPFTKEYDYKYLGGVKLTDVNQRCPAGFAIDHGETRFQPDPMGRHNRSNHLVMQVTTMICFANDHDTPESRFIIKKPNQTKIYSRYVVSPYGFVGHKPKDGKVVIAANPDGQEVRKGYGDPVLWEANSPTEVSEEINSDIKVFLEMLKTDKPQSHIKNLAEWNAQNEQR